LENYFKIDGTVYEITPVETVGKKNFQKRTIVLEVINESNGNTFTETIPFEVLGQKTETIESYTVGDVVEIGFSLRGRKWAPADQPEKYRYFGSNTLLTIQLKTKRTVPPEQTAAADVQSVTNEAVDNGGFDDLPF